LPLPASLCGVMCAIGPVCMNGHAATHLYDGQQGVLWLLGQVRLHLTITVDVLILNSPMYPESLSLGTTTALKAPSLDDQMLGSGVD